MSKLQMAEAQCDRCYEAILWATNSATGNRVPLNARPDRLLGNFILDEITMYCTRLDLPLIERAIQRGRSLFSNHLVTCVKRQAERQTAA